MKTRPVVVLLLTGLHLMLPCCSSGEAGSQDAGEDAAEEPVHGQDGDGSDAADTTGHDGQDSDIADAADAPGPDGDRPAGGDAGAVFRLQVPAGTRLCSTFYAGRTPQEEMQLKSRIDLRPGTYLLPRQQGSYPADFIETILFGPDRQALPPPTGDCVFAAEHREDDWLYRYLAQYDLGGEAFQVEVHLVLPDPGGQDTIDITLDREVLSARVTAHVAIGAGVSADEVQGFGSCDPVDTWHILDGQTAAGDRAVLDVRSCAYCPVCGPPPFNDCRFLAGAALTSDGTDHSQNDPLGLAYACGPQHNGCQQFLVQLDPPAGNTSTLIVAWPDWCSDMEGWFIHLDADGQEISRAAITDWQER